MQQLLRLLIFLNQLNIFRATNSPILMSTFSISTVAPVDSRGGALYQELYIQSKYAPEDGRICRPKHVGLI
jgi:hypothetical protein